MEHLFVSDLHGDTAKYETLYEVISDENPDGVLLGGDILPHRSEDMEEFIETYISSLFSKLPTRAFVILGNDDPRIYETLLIEADEKGYIDYVHKRPRSSGDHWVVGYSYVPPTPFMRKDWERYDVSRFTDVGAISPENGYRTVPAKGVRFKTIQEDMESLSKLTPPEKTIYLFHSPPYDTALDLTKYAGMMVDHTPVDPHVGSIAIKRFIASKQPMVTLHGHIHESARLTGSWKEKIGSTYALSAAHDGPELAVVSFDSDHPENASRRLYDL